MWATRRESNPKTKSSRSHIKIPTNLYEICWKCLRITGCDFVQIGAVRSTCGAILKTKHMICMENGFCVTWRYKFCLVCGLLHHLVWFGYIRVMGWMVWFQINFVICMVWFSFGVVLKPLAALAPGQRNRCFTWPDQLRVRKCDSPNSC
jgi:hypothetical protein